MPIPEGSATVGRSLLRDDVYRRLRDAIVDGTFAPGEQLKDGELAEWLGVSRTPIREALLRLGTNGLVVAIPGRSTTVSQLDSDAVRDARDVIGAMHALAVQEATPLMTASDIERMRVANGRFRKAVAANDINAALDADEEVHHVPVAVLGNKALESVIEHFDPLVRRSERVRFIDHGDASAQVHDELIDLIAEGRADEASTVAYNIWRSLDAEPDAGR
ncbi:DNA-binding GntR family transcriptional regulator [Microbacteriaceae bacterium SG_E_30_P1]|uniref:DNA-binding GntR family transcriptional regulator n=1 Tax=Antiquaquibacter oligotrophicus TaxID=2880260 RepID=A0ABT6KRF0_9MICO|nr:GntR family transcriptional regulator [Antiquaquibacter oligotrophicus]MDH6182556.1 DNA-binding GntR family transcriptional regulator [Antiquaquibacter oligotrophicus]UDF14477.1 GntR family transcriptional regulator [Antiquaquibacter oligotrophicus]